MRSVPKQSTVSPSDADILARSTLEAGKLLGLSQSRISEILGRDRSTVSRNGIDPQSKAGQLAVLLIRIYRSLSALMGGDEENMRHFMKTTNRATGGVPKEQLCRPEGLVAVCEYLDAIRGRA